MRQPTLRQTMLPRDTNAFGTIFGGVILSNVDLAGWIACREQVPLNFATRAMREVEFIAPVYVGDVVSYFTEVVREGRTSLTVRIEVEAERFSNPKEIVRVTAAEVTYVAVNEEGAAVVLHPET